MLLFIAKIKIFFFNENFFKTDEETRNAGTEASEW